MESRDHELDELLEPLRSEDPGEVALARWRRAVRRELERGRSRPAARWPVAAALLLGFGLGAVAFRTRTTKEAPPVATIEHVIANSD